MKDQRKGDKNLLDGALNTSGGRQTIYLANGNPHISSSVPGVYTKEELAAKEAKRSEKIMNESDEFQKQILEYNKSLNSVDKRFGDIELPKKSIIVKLARLNHIDPTTGFVIPRKIMEPSRSGADVPGNYVDNKYPYYLFGYVAASNSDEIVTGRYVQLSEDAVRQTFLKEEGKWRHHLTTEFLFWNDNTDERLVDTLECYVLIKDYQVELMFKKDYEPEFN